MAALPAAMTNANGSKSQRRGWAGLTTSLASNLDTGLPGGLLLAAVASPAMALRVVSKLGNICPLGYVDTLNGKCSTLGLMSYTVTPTHGKPCLPGWMNVGGRYGRRQ
jgi:hypothetical protein